MAKKKPIRKNAKFAALLRLAGVAFSLAFLFGTLFWQLFGSMRFVQGYIIHPQKQPASIVQTDRSVRLDPSIQF
jgi:hypothetical protein